MADRTEIAFRRTAAELIPREAHVLVAVSGGGDSVALLVLMQQFARSHEIRLTVAHLDHGLRRGSRADRKFVEALASRLGLDCIADRREVAELRRRDESPEEAARRVRRTFLIEHARLLNALVATGHTLDDQAETILMRWVRGAGATALAGINNRGPGPFVRPLLGFERAELRAFLRRRSERFREDASNRDLRFDRNRVRRLILPQLSDQLNPRAARQIVRSAGLLEEDARFLDDLARDHFDSLVQPSRTGAQTWVHGSIAALPSVLARRVARIALQRAGLDARRIGSRHIEALLDLDRGPSGRSIDLPGRFLARIWRGRVRVAPRRMVD